MSQSILTHKIKKLLNPSLILGFIFTKFVPLVFMIGTLVTVSDIIICGILLNMSLDFIVSSSIIASILITIVFLILDSRHDQQTQEEEKNKELEKQTPENPLEYNVQKTIRMEVIAKNEVTNSDGRTVRELLLKDPIGRVIEYGREYSHKNLNTIFFAVTQGSYYNFEWEFIRYDPTHKWSTYDKILKIDDRDVDLHIY